MSQAGIRRIAAAVVQRPDGRILLLRRALTHTTNAGKWCFVTGYVEDDEQPRDAAIRELREELGIESTPSHAGNIVVVHTDWGGTLHIYPFLFPVPEITVKLDREHVDYRWIEPQQLYDYEFVQQLDEDLMALGLL